MTDLDLGSLQWALSQSDLELRCEFGQSATGNERLDTAPKEANFYWKRGNELIYSIEVSRAELADLIQTLESNGVNVPDEFHEALEEFPI